MRYLLAGLGNIGKKRQAILGGRCVATADPFNPAADYLHVTDCPLDTYDAAILAVPNRQKLELLEFLLSHGKHVLVEKPLLFARRAQVDTLCEVARRTQALWYTSYNHRFEPMIAAAKQAVEAGVLGQFLHGRLFYGNGTVTDVAGSWRDGGLGVVEDLGCHLLDLTSFLLPDQASSFVPWALHRFEASGYDHAILGSADGRLALEMSFLSWKNTFSLDLFGEAGSVHVAGLVKWGPSTLSVKQRVRPSGVPIERVQQTATGEDQTWARDLAHFESEVDAGRSSAEHDWWISTTLHCIPLP